MADKKQDPLLTPKDLSDHIGVPTSTLANWRWRGEGPQYKKLGRHVRYRWHDVRRWLDENAHGGEAA